MEPKSFSYFICDIKLEGYSKFADWRLKFSKLGNISYEYAVQLMKNTKDSSRFNEYLSLSAFTSPDANIARIQLFA